MFASVLFPGLVPLSCKRFGMFEILNIMYLSCMAYKAEDEKRVYMVGCPAGSQED